MACSHIRRTWLSAAAGVVLTLGALGPACHKSTETLPAGAPASPPSPAQPQAGGPAGKAPPSTAESRGIQLLQELSSGVAGIAAQAKPAVVSVSVSKPGPAVPFGNQNLPPDVREFLRRFFDWPAREQGQGGGPQDQVPRVEGVGSGFITDLAHGYVVTNNHVVEGADEITVHLATGVTSAAKVVGRDRNTDLAVVQLTGEKLNKSGLGALAFADSDKVRVGDFALAVGAPFGLEASVSFGVVSATGRGTLGITQLGDFLQTDAAVNPGNSGGPLLNPWGQAIGVNTAIFSQTGGYAGIGFAIPSNLARLVVERLIAKGRVDRGYLGLSLQAISPELRDGLGVAADVEGALVANVQAASPAAKAGIQVGDVITGVNGRPLKGEMDLVNSIGLMEPGQKVALKYLRSGGVHTASIELSKWPAAVPTGLASEPGEPGPAAGDQDALGLGLATVSPGLKQRFGFTSDQGAVVVQVLPGSAAAQAGIDVGDVVLSVGQEPVSGPADVQRLVQGKPRALLRLERQGSYFFVLLPSPTRQSPGASH